MFDLHSVGVTSEFLLFFGINFDTSGLVCFNLVLVSFQILSALADMVPNIYQTLNDEKQRRTHINKYAYELRTQLL